MPLNGTINVSPEVLEAVRILKLRGGYRSMSDALHALLQTHRADTLRLAQVLLEERDEKLSQEA